MRYRFDRVQALHQDGNRELNDKNYKERPEGIRENGRLWAFPALDCYVFNAALCAVHYLLRPDGRTRIMALTLASVLSSDRPTAPPAPVAELVGINWTDVRGHSLTP